MFLSMPKLRKRDDGGRLAFYGPMCSGKTFVATHLVDAGNYEKVGLADKLKAVAYDLYGLQTKNGVGRKLLQEFSDDIKKWDEEVFIKHFFIRVQNIESRYRVSPKIVCDDVRYLREAKVFKKAGFKLIKVTCDEKVRLERVQKLYPDMNIEVAMHRSENEFSFIDKLADGEINSTDASVISEIEKFI